MDISLKQLLHFNLNYLFNIGNPNLPIYWIACLPVDGFHMIGIISQEVKLNTDSLCPRISTKLNTVALSWDTY